MLQREGQGRRKQLKLGGGGTTLRGHFSLRKRGHFLKIKRAIIWLFQSLGGHVPPVPPVPTSMAKDNKRNLGDKSPSITKKKHDC